MRIATLLEWGALVLLFAVVAVLALNIGSFRSPELPFTAAPMAALISGPVNCSEWGYGGFYQEPLPASAPRSIPLQAGDWTCTITPLYTYTIVGKVVGKDEYLPTGSDLISPMDLTIANGDVINPAYAGRLSFTKTHRSYTFLYHPPKGPQPFTYQYIVEHTSNNHLLFADETVHDTARSFRTGDVVRLSGYLVTIAGTDTSGRTTFQGTSTTRSDMGEGSCEVMYVTSAERLPC